MISHQYKFMITEVFVQLFHRKYQRHTLFIKLNVVVSSLSKLTLCKHRHSRTSKARCIKIASILQGLPPQDTTTDRLHHSAPRVVQTVDHFWKLSQHRGDTHLNAMAPTISEAFITFPAWNSNSAKLILILDQPLEWYPIWHICRIRSHDNTSHLVWQRLDPRSIGHMPKTRKLMLTKNICETWITWLIYLTCPTPAQHSFHAHQQASWWPRDHTNRSPHLKYHAISYPWHSSKWSELRQSHTAI